MQKITLAQQAAIKNMVDIIKDCVEEDGMKSDFEFTVLTSKVLSELMQRIYKERKDASNKNNYDPLTGPGSSKNLM